MDQFEYGDTNREFVPAPKHKYTIHLHRAVFTEELYALYKRYELHVHKKERPPSQLQRFLCNSPLFDPAMEPQKANACMLFNSAKIDQTYHTWQDEGHCPLTMGTYHFYHRIDGKLVAVGVCDITNRYFNSAYFIYDPDFMFLNLGVVGAIRELEFCRRIKK